MEKNNKDMMCSCDNCKTYVGGHSFYRFYWLRWFLGLIILGLVFGIGYKIGEFKGYFESNFSGSNYGSRRMMMPYFNYYPQDYMMPLPGANTQTSATGTSTKTK